MVDVEVNRVIRPGTGFLIRLVIDIESESLILRYLFIIILFFLFFFNDDNVHGCKWHVIDTTITGKVEPWKNAHSRVMDGRASAIGPTYVSSSRVDQI